MKRRAKAWVRAHGTRAGIDVAYAALKPYLLAAVVDFEADGGERFETSVVHEVAESVARYWSRAGWGYFVRYGRYKTWIFEGKGAHPRGPERPHLRFEYFRPRRHAAMAAHDELKKAGYPHPTQRQVIERVRSTTGLDISRASARGWIDETPALKSALARLAPIDAALARELRLELPKTKIHVLALADVASMLWKPSACESTRRVHRKRAADAMLRIGAARVGMNVAVVGDSVIVAMHRSIPADPAAHVAKTKVRALRCGFVNTRETQAKQDLSAARQLVGYIGAWIEDIQESMWTLTTDDACEENGARIWIEQQVEAGVTFAGDLSRIHDAETRAIMQVMEISGPVTWLEEHKVRGDSSLAATMGVIPRHALDVSIDGREVSVPHPEHDVRKAEHQAAFGGLATAYGKGEDFGMLYRRAHYTGSLPMQSFARRIACALDGHYDVDRALAALPVLAKPGRARRQPSAQAVAAARSRPSRRIVLAAPRRLGGKVPSVHPKMRVDAAPPKFVIPPIPANYDPDRDGPPWLLHWN